MTENQRLLLEIIKYEFGGQANFELLRESDWNEVFDEASYQRMIPFVYDAVTKIQDLKIEDTLLQAAKNATLCVLAQNMNSIQKQKEILQSLEQAKIKYCILKGTSISVFYPKPQLRALGDFDIYVRPEEIAKASEVVEALGYAYEKTSTQYHTAFVREGYEIELHNSVAGLPYGQARTALSFLKDLCERGNCGNKNYGNYWVPSVCDNGIIQLLHILHHTKHKGMKIRLLCDWMMFVDKNVTDDVWNHELAAVYRQAHLEHMAKLITKLCKCYLGLNNSDITWCDDVAESACMNFLEYVMEHDKPSTVNEHQYEGTLREDIWEYKGQSDSGSYRISLIKRNLLAIKKGEKSVKQCYGYFKQKNETAEKLVRLNLLEKKEVQEYAYGD